MARPAQERAQQRHRWQAGGWASLEAGDPVFGIALAVATFAAIAGVTAGVRQARGWGWKARVVGHAALGAAAASLVFLLQSVSVGASLGGAILSLAVGGMTLLVLMLAGSA